MAINLESKIVFYTILFDFMIPKLLNPITKYVPDLSIHEFPSVG